VTLTTEGIRTGTHSERETEFQILSGCSKIYKYLGSYVVEELAGKDHQAPELNKEDARDRSRWKKLIKNVR